MDIYIYMSSIWIYIYIYVYICIYVYMYICIYVYMYMYIYIYIWLVVAANPSEKSWSESQLGWWHSQLNGTNVPNHQPEIVHQHWYSDQLDKSKQSSKSHPMASSNSCMDWDLSEGHRSKIFKYYPQYEHYNPPIIIIHRTMNKHEPNGSLLHFGQPPSDILYVDVAQWPASGVLNQNLDRALDGWNLGGTSRRVTGSSLYIRIRPAAAATTTATTCRKCWFEKLTTVIIAWAAQHFFFPWCLAAISPFHHHPSASISPKKRLGNSKALNTPSYMVHLGDLPNIIITMERSSFL